MGYKTFFEQIKTVCAWNSLKKGVRKFNIAHLSIVNNYSKCLMCASTALQTNLEHIFFEKKTHKHISFQYENFNCPVIPAEIDDFSNPLWGHSTKIPFQSN